MDDYHASRLKVIALWIAPVSAAHFVLGTHTHLMHGLHIILAGMFLIPVLIGAAAFEVKGGLLTAVVVSVLYALHLLWSWRHSPLGNPDQYAMIGIYFIVGLAAGRLARSANYRKWQRDEVIRRAYEEEQKRASLPE
jgi:hypothetical protein